MRTPKNKPFTSDLSGQDFWTLLQAGYAPLALVMGSCVYHVAHQGLGQWMRSVGQNQEMPNFTQALYDARELAMERMQTEAQEVSAEGIVGAQIPIATGVALKSRYRKDGGVVLCWFGDGAIHQGSFHESLNMAKIWKLPVIYICENNQYGMGTDFRRVSSVVDFVVMGESYGIPGKQVNGMDVVEVYNDVKEAVERVRAEATPLFLEIKTYRYRGHSMSDPAKYRTPEELESYKKQDPILILKSRMEESGSLTEDQYAAMDGAVKQICDDAVKFAEESPEPDPSALYEDVLA